MARAATETQKAGLAGLEYGLAIPGTVGGAVWANAGAHESDTASVLESATVVLADGTERELAGDELGFGLPRQPVQARRGRRDRRSRRGRPDGDLRARAGDDPATIKERLDDIRRWRQAHQPLGMPSAGSVFRNPDGDSAGRLIDELGLKGQRIGGAVGVREAR